MKNEKIGRMLRYYRKLCNYSIETVSEQLNDANLPSAVKTIYSWEAGRTQPDADRLMFLCKLYGIDDILTAFGYNEEDDEQTAKKNFRLTAFEIKLIKSYRKHPDLHTAVNRLLEIEPSPSPHASQKNNEKQIEKEDKI